MPLPKNAVEQRRVEDDEYIQENSKVRIQDAIADVDDPDVVRALEEIAHILTGDDRFEQ